MVPWSFLHPQYPGQCLAHRWCWINVCRRDQGFEGLPINLAPPAGLRALQRASPRPDCPNSKLAATLNWEGEGSSPPHAQARTSSPSTIHLR